MTELLNNITIPTTGMVFIFGAFVYLYLSGKFYQCHRAENNRIARLFSYSFLLIGLNYLICSIPCLFLIEDQAVWKIVAPIYGILTGAGWFLFFYAVMSTRFPQYTKLIGGLLFGLMLIFAPMFLVNTPHYFFVDGVLDWEVNSLLWVSFFSLFPFLTIPAIIIFFKQFKEAEDKKIKIRSLGFALATVWLLSGAVTDFFLITFLKVHPIYSDLNYFIVFSILAITLIFTWFRPMPKRVTKVE